MITKTEMSRLTIARMVDRYNKVSLRFKFGGLSKEISGYDLGVTASGEIKIIGVMEGNRVKTIGIPKSNILLLSKW